MTDIRDAQEHLFVPAALAGASESKLLAWHVREGDAFDAGQVLAELESDKAVMELTAERSGVIETILVAAGTEGVQVGAPIARVRYRLA